MSLNWPSRVKERVLLRCVNTDGRDVISGLLSLCRKKLSYKHIRDII